MTQDTGVSCGTRASAKAGLTSLPARVSQTVHSGSVMVVPQMPVPTRMRVSPVRRCGVR
jgi:hypothetical protein